MAARKSTTAAPAAPALDPALVAAIAQAVIAQMGGNEVEPTVEVKPVGVKASTRKAAPAKESREDKDASLRQKRTLVDYTAEAVLSKRITADRKRKIEAAAKAYETALNAYLLAVGVTGPANLSMADAFDMIAEAKAAR